MKKLPANYTAILQILNDGNFHDGTFIGQQLNITRSAVWKLIQQLQAYGLPIQSTKGKGYRLPDPIYLLDAPSIATALPTDLRNKTQLDIFASIDSTNQYLKQHLPLAADKLQVCLAESQTAGKGRTQRPWYSPFAQNIYLSCHYFFQQPMNQLSSLSLVIGLAIVNTLQQFIPEKSLSLKWPNDVILACAKLAGCLVEVQGESHGGYHVIIGVGINVNMHTLPDAQSIDQAWTSLYRYSGQRFNRNAIIAAFLTQLDQYITRFKTHGFADFLTEWQQYDHLAHKQITINQGSQQLTGITQGVDNSGALLLQQANGEIIPITYGDASIAKEYL
jgi:BirA family biotin operon repressor/biotin-[acetyl-CoA-carboxylase] ligase